MIKKFSDYFDQINESLNVIAKEGDFKLVKTVRWGYLVTHVIYKGDTEIGQYPPNLKSNIAKCRFERDFAGGEIQPGKRTYSLYENLLESKEDKVEALLNKTIKRGSTKAEEYNAYKKALEIIKKNNIDIQSLNIEDPEVIKKLQSDYIDYQEKKPFSEYTVEDFLRWKDDNYEKIEEVGYKLEDKLKSFPNLDKKYDSGYYEDDDGNMMKDEEFPGGWDFVDQTRFGKNGKDYIVYNFQFYAPRDLDQYKSFIDELVLFRDFVGVDQAEVSPSNNYANLSLELKLTLEDLYKNMDKLGIE